MVSGRVVCHRGVCLRTFLVAAVFALSVAAAPGDHHRRARDLVLQAQQTSNPIRLFILALDIREALEAALSEKPDDVEVRLDLVRFFVMTPRIAGGNLDQARAQAEEIARRDAPLGHFARGYIAYRQKEYGVARIALREAIRTVKKPEHRAMAAKWLGWLSQESQQWNDAFAIFEEVRATDPEALYEIARTSSFCSCELEKGRAALAEYLKLRPGHEEAVKLREKLK
jgi:tetratricopeptide (TPR) repeat protein